MLEQPADVREFLANLWDRPEDFIGDLWERRDWLPDGALQTQPLQLWEQQLAVLHAVRDYKLTAVRSGHGVGKTMVGSIAAILFLLTHYPSYVVTTGSSWRTLEKVLWPQIRELIQSSRYKFSSSVPLQMNWRPIEGLDRWAMVAVSANDRNNFAGFHNKHVFVLLEEADGVSEEIFEAAFGNAVGANDRILAIGNPHTPGGPFHQKFLSPDWHKVHISCHDHPNVKSGREIFPGMVTREWIELMKTQLGVGSPAYRSRVDGEFPEEDEMTLCRLGWINLAAGRPPVEDKLLDRRTCVLSADVGRSATGDESVILCKNHQQVLRMEHHRGLKLPQTTGRIVQVAREQWEKGMPCRKIIVDDVGIGGGVTDGLEECREELARYGVESVFPFLGGERADDPNLFFNARSEAYWFLRMSLNPDDSQFHLPPVFLDQMSELASIRLKPEPKGRIQVMPKDEMIKRGYLKRSPNFADAWMMSCSPLALGTGVPQSIPFTPYGR